MIKWLITFLLFPLWASGQFFHQIPDCYSDIAPVHYYIEQNSELNYTYEIVGGEILASDNDGVLVSWLSGGQLTVIATNSLGCSSYSTLTMELIPCDQTSFFVPSAFTPNIDYINDTFTPKGVNFKYYEMTIFNRWGQELYFTRNISTGWNGRYRWQDCPNGVYVYQIVYQDHENYYHTLTDKFVLLR